MRRIHVVVGLLLFAFITSVEAQTQNYYTLTGTPPGMTLYPIPGGFVNLDNGNLFLKFPLASIPQRSGKPVTLSLVYNSSFWGPANVSPPGTGSIYYPQNQGGLSLTTDWGFEPYATHDTTPDQSQCPANYPYGVADIYNNYRTVDSNGTEIRFVNLQVSDYNCQNSSGQSYPGGEFGTKAAAGWSLGNTGYFLSVDNYGHTYKLWAPDGTLTTYDSSGTSAGPTGLMHNDSNGNLLGIFQYDPSTGDPIDQLGRKGDVLYGSSSTPCPSLDGSLGAGVTPTESCSVVVQTDDGPASYTWHYTQIPICTYFNNQTGNQYCGNINMPDSLTLPTGAQYQFTYDTGTSPGHYGTLTGITLPTGGHLSYSYLANNHWTNLYGLNYVLPQSASDGFGTTTFSFSSSSYSNGSVNIIDPRNDTVTYTTNQSGTSPYNYTKILSQYSGTSTLLKTTTTVTDGALHPLSVTTAWNTSGAATTTYQYQPNTWLVSLKQEGDFSGAVVRTTKIDYLTDTGGIPYVSQYHILNRPQQVRVFAGSATSGTPLSQSLYTYDEYAAGFCKNGVPGLTDHTSATGHSTSYGTSYTARGNVTTTSRLISGTSYATTHTCYDTLGNVTQTVDANGNPTTVAYTDSWASGGSATCTIGSNTYAYPTTITNALGQQQKFSYSTCSGQRTASKDSNDIAAGRSGTTYQYAEPRERLTSVSYPDGGYSTTSYNDPAGTQTDSTQITASQAKTVVTAYDGLGRVKQTQLTSDPAGVVYQDTSYDASGNVFTVSNPYRSTSDPTHGTTQYAYDALQRQLKKTNPDNSFQTWSYNGSTTLFTDENGNQSPRTQDALGRLIIVKEPDAFNRLIVETDYTYDALSNLTRVDQWGGVPGIHGERVRTFSYDGLSQLVQAFNPETGWICYGTTGGIGANGGNCTSGYDGNGNLGAKTDGRGFTSTYHYDSLNRMTLESSNAPNTLTHSWTYDASSVAGIATTNPIGRVVFVDSYFNSTPVVQQSGTIYWKYDQLGRVQGTKICTPTTCNSTNINTSTWYDLANTYDLAGNMASYTDGFGTTISSTYDPAGRLSKVTSSKNDLTHPGTLWTANSYSAIGLTKATLGNGVVDTRQYTNRTWLQSLNTKTATGPVIYSEALTYYSNGNLQTVTDPVNGNWSYTYDPMNRISTGISTNTGQGCQFTYDAFGNRATQAPDQGTCTSPTFTFTGSLTNHIDGYCYDGAGNLNDAGPCPPTGSNHQYFYDGYNHLLSPNFNQTGGAGYTVDAFGHRVAKYLNGTLTRVYLYGLDGNPVAEMNGAGAWQQTNVHVGGQFLAEYQGNDTDFQHSDHLGTIRAQSNSAGTRVTTCANLPFGDSLNCNGNSNPSGYHFTGKERDTESGLDNFDARYYGSSMGRFMSPDPSGLHYADKANPQSLNLYSYVLNNPLTNTDPDGRECVWEDGSYDSNDDTVTGSNAVDSHGNFIGCSGQGGTWIDHSFFTGNVMADWSSHANQTLASFTVPSVTVNETPNPNLTLDVPMVVWNWAFMQTTPVHGPWTYGNWAGEDGMGAPIDDADAGAMVHDYCYNQAGGLTTGTNFGPHNASLQACNQALCNTEENTRSNLLAKEQSFQGVTMHEYGESQAAQDIVNYFSLVPFHGNRCH